jgi:hypothetical protein
VFINWAISKNEIKKLKQMRKITFLILIFNCINLNAQSKKELEQKIILIEEENKSVKVNLSNALNSLNLITSKSYETEKIVLEQKNEILNLKKNNDSLIQIIKQKNENSLIETLSTEHDSIIKLFQSYFGSKKWEDRIPYVINNSNISSIMGEFYKDDYSPSFIKKDQVHIKGSDFKINQVFNVNIGNEYAFYCKKTLDGYKIDWLASKGYNKTSIKAFLANTDIKNEVFRIIGSLGNYYNYSYRNQKDAFWNISISNEGDGISECYVNKNSETGKKLYKILNDGKEHKIIIELKRDINDEHCYLIEKIISETWSIQ